MTNKEKNKLRQLIKEGYNFDEIKEMVDCCDGTIKNYIKVFGDKNEN